MRSFFLAVLVLSPAAVGQCPPATTYVGFHQENVGAALAAQGGEAIFGHFAGFGTGIFEPQANEYWTRIGLVGGGTTNPCAMGWSVAMEGDVVAAGDPCDSSLTGGSIPHGAAAIIERVSGTWSTTATLFPPAPSGSQFGSAVAISEDELHVAVAAPLENGAGAVYLYTKSLGAWSLSATLAPPSLVAGSGFGKTCHLQNGRCFVGATQQGADGTVFVFEQQGSSWIEVDQITASGAQTGGAFGWEIHGAGDTLYVSAPARPVATGTGEVLRFDLVQGMWMQGPALLPSWPGPVLSFGRGLAYQGGRLAVGGLGYAGVFEPDAAAGWIPLGQYTYPDSVTYSDFGYDVALYDDGLLVGAPQYDENGFLYPDNTGAVHAYDLSDYGQSLVACGHAVVLSASAADGEHLLLDEPAYPYQPFLILGSATGQGPTTIAGVTLPLTLDSYFVITATAPGGSTLPGGFGSLDASGRAEADFQIPAGLPPTLAGLVVHHAFATWVPGGSALVSNAVSVTLVP